MAAELLGIRFIYLEAGSGAKKAIPPKTIHLVKSHTNVPIIVGGGIRTSKSALEAKKAGANIIVTGTLVEEKNEIHNNISEIVKAIQN
jgi:phosphoglycerol geranylgeranyltransferase